MLINAEVLLQYQRCKRRPYLDSHEDKGQRDAADYLLLKLQQDKIAHQMGILAKFTYQRPDYPRGDWHSGQTATLELMQQGVECIHQAVLLATTEQEYTLSSRPDLLLKRPGNSRFGDWMYVPASIELGKRPKQEYQVIAAFHAQVLATVQQAELETAWLILRDKEANYPVDLSKWTPLMQRIIQEYIETQGKDEAPEVFISRQKCSFCHWHSACYTHAKSENHLSLLPGVTPGRYTQLKTLDITSLESLAQSNPSELENLPGFEREVAPNLILQAQSLLFNRPLRLPVPHEDNYISHSLLTLSTKSSVEIYFDIEAQPDLNLDYLLGVLIVDRQANTEYFYSLLAESLEDEKIIWQQFVQLVSLYPEAPIYHFCVYEFDTIKRLAKLYRTPYSSIQPILHRFVDIYEELIQRVALPVESYALKAIARWLDFEWRDLEASGAKCIYWYDQWLQTGDRTFLEAIQRYNEDDCRATRSVKDWLVNFLANS